MTFAQPTITHVDLRSRGRRWRRDEDELDAWRDGLTGYPIVDAGMRQLLREGWMHGRARMIVATFLTKHLGHDWREGARHFARLLLDADVANNAANWQWVAGTGADTRPGRILNPLRQAERFDRDGAYVRRYVPELSHLDRRSHPDAVAPPGARARCAVVSGAAGRSRARRRGLSTRGQSWGRVARLRDQLNRESIRRGA